MENGSIFENDLIKVEYEPFEIPWFKVFAKEECKEFSECSSDTKEMIFKALDIIEKEMIKFFNPTKINIASFGNIVPQVHWHIQARFQEDSYFPESIWGKVQRASKINIDIEEFCDVLAKKLEAEI